MFDILLVDDEETFHLLYGEVFHEAFNDCNIVDAYSAEQALDILTNNTPDIILLDIRLLPEGMSGLQLLKIIRATRPSIPIFMVTAYDTYRDNVSTWLADEYFVKSSDFTELNHAIRFYRHSKTTKLRIFQEAFPFPLSYNFICLQSRINFKEILDQLFNLTEYVMKYALCILIAQTLIRKPYEMLSILKTYKNIKMTMGKWYEFMKKVAYLNQDDSECFVSEISSFIFASPKKLTPEMLNFEKIISMRNDIHKRPYSERSSHQYSILIKQMIMDIMDKCIFFKNYTLQIVESAIPDPEGSGFIYNIKSLMGSHPEFMIIPTEDQSIYPYQEIILTKGNSPQYLNLEPFMIYGFCPNNARDDVFFFERLGRKTDYKSSQQGHIISKEIDIVKNLDRRYSDKSLITTLQPPIADEVKNDPQKIVDGKTGEPLQEESGTEALIVALQKGTFARHMRPPKSADPDTVSNMQQPTKESNVKDDGE